MKKTDFEKELSQKMSSEEITLPESLSAENIEKLINEKGSIIEPKRIVSFPKKNVAKWISVAATLVILIGVAAVVGLGNLPVEKANQLNDEEQQQIIENHVAQPSDYSEIHKTVLSYYKEIYNRNYDLLTDSDDGFFDGIFNFGSKDTAAENTVAGTNSSSSATGTVATDTESASTQHSTTNTQVQGVDEADIVKTDGKYIYYIVNNTINIIECDADGKMDIVSKIKLTEYISYDFYPSEMYLYNDNLVVLLRETSEYQPVSYNNSYGELCDCVCVAVKTDTVVKCFDISDRANPQESFTHKLTGEYISSRVTDGKLITVAQFLIPYNSVQADDFDGACEVVKDVCVPEYSVGDGELKKIPSDRIKVFDEKNPTCYTVTSVLNLEDMSAEPKVNAFLGGAEEIYCTREEIFVAETVYMTWTNNEQIIATDDLGNKYETATKVHKMDITDDGVNYVAAAKVGGMCINQFSMDKNGEYFRIATNGWDYNIAEQKTMVYVLDKDMKIVGFLDNIAPEEQMKSARFMGDVLYLVTFMQTDPLFVVDLSDPENPEIKGELKIPGFSTYLHPAGDGLLIGVGEGGTMTGTDGTAKISLFDVSDPASPKELDNYTTYFVGDFVRNHKAFSVIDENTFAIPFFAQGQGESILVFSIENNSITIDNYFDCLKYNGFYNTTRAVFIDSALYAVNTKGIVAYNMTNAEKLSEIKF